jgi:hypothetical protein
MRKFSIDFQRVPVGFEFRNGGNTWFKQSTRTARIIHPTYKRWFYFTRWERCEVVQQTDFNPVGLYGVYRVMLLNGFTSTVNASSEREAIDTLISSKVFNAPDSAIFSCQLITTL